MLSMRESTIAHINHENHAIAENILGQNMSKKDTQQWDALNTLRLTFIRVLMI
jgi:hypothetical protein